MSDDQRGVIRSVDRAVTVLQLIALGGEARVTDLARELGVNRSTVFRILLTLERRGLVVQEVERGTYRLDSGVVNLAQAVHRLGDPLRASARLSCQALAAEVGETANLAVFDGESVISVEQDLGGATVTSVNWIGQLTPVHATSAGKVFLAHLADLLRRQLLDGPLATFTPWTITDRDRLERELDLVRERGYATTTDEHEEGLSAVGAPVRGPAGDVVAAVTVSGPTFRFGPERTGELAAAVVRAAGSLSARLGWSGPRQPVGEPQQRGDAVGV